MNNTFELKKGKLVFEEDKIVITDDAKTQRRYRLFSSVFMVLLGIYSLLKYMNAGDVHSLRFGLIFGLAGLLSFVFEFLKSDQSEIPLKEVKSMKVKRSLFKEFFVIKLTNNKTRTVVGIYNAERLEEYIKTNSFPS